MIDSVVLQLNNNQFKLREKNKFDAAKYQKGKGFSIDSEFSITYLRQWQKQGVYCPVFSLSKKKQGYTESQEVLEIQVSLQKLVHGTNLYDVDISNLDQIIRRLLFFLDDLGIETTGEELKKAVVRRADFSKVIILPDYLGRVDEVIRVLSQFEYKPQSDFRLTEYNNGKDGISIKFINSTQGYAIYDKLAEIIHQGFTKQELKLKELYEQKKFKRNIIKFELSLQRKGSFEAVVNRKVKTGKKKDFYLEEILNKELAQAILCDAFEKVFSNIAVGMITLSRMEDNKLLIYLEGSELNQAKQERLYYWVRMTTKYGIAGTWEELKHKYSGGSIDTRKKEISQILIELGEITGNVPNLIDFLRAEHKNFTIIKPKVEL